MRSARIEGRRTARELVEAEGFRLEDHHAVTADGFVLVMHRVLDPDRVRISVQEAFFSFRYETDGRSLVVRYPPPPPQQPVRLLLIIVIYCYYLL